MPAEYTITGNVEGEDGISRSVYVQTTTDVANPTEDIDYAKARRFQASDGVFTIPGNPAHDALNEPYSASGPQHGVLVSYGQKKWTIPAQADGAIVAAADFTEAWAAPVTNSQYVDVMNAASEVAADRAAVEAIGTTNDAIIAGRINASGSATDVALKNAIGAGTGVTISLKNAAPPSGSNDTTAVQAALTALDSAGGGVLKVPRGTWTFTGSTGLALVSTNPIVIDAEDGALFDFTGSTATTALKLGGSQGSSSALGADVAKGAEAITCGLSVAAGDLILLTSTVNWENFSNQKQGEMAEVLSVSGGVISLKGGLFDSYTAATTTVTKINAPRVSITGRLRIKRASNHRGVEISNARNVVVSGLDIEGARERLLYLNYCYNATVAQCSGRDFWYSGTGTSYGLVVAGSQHVREIGNDFRGGRHAITHGGFFPCRDIQVIGGTFDNYHASGQASVDFHADCEHVKIIGAAVLNGLNSQASNVFIGGGTLLRGVTRSGAEVGPARSCDYIKFENVDVETVGTNDGIQYIARNGSNATVLGLLKIDATIRSGAACVSILPSSTSNTGATIDRLHVRGDLTAGGSSQCVAITNAAPASVAINDATIEAAPRFHAPASHGIALQGTSTGRCRLRGRFSTGLTNGSPVRVEMFGDVRVADAELVGTSPFRSKFTNSGLLVLDGVLIDGASSAGGIEANAGPTEALLVNVRRINVTGTLLLPVRNYSHLDAGGCVTTQGTAAPTKGVWNQGDRCNNTTPAAAGAPGWDCTTAGGASSATWAATTAYTLGTWVKTSTGKVLEVTTAGTSSSSEPAPTVIGATATDGTVTWTYRSATSAMFKARASLAA